MVRVTLLVTVLAALCYTSQAYNLAHIPAQVGNTGFELRKEISDQIQPILDLIPKEVQDKIDFKNKLPFEIFEQLVNEAEKGKTTAINIFEKAKENAKKLFQEGQNVNQVFEKLKNVEEEIVTNYQYALNNKIQNIKDTLIGKLIKEELKPKLQEKLDSFQGKVKENTEVLRKKQSDGESYGIGIGNILKEGKSIVNGVQDKLTGSSKKIMDDANEIIEKFKENVDKILEKSVKVKELKNILDKSFDELKETIKNDEAGKVKRSISDVIRDKQQAGGLLGITDNLWKEIKNGTKKNIGDNRIDFIKNALDNIKKLLDDKLAAEKETKEDVKGNTEEDTEEDTEDDTEN